MKFLVDFTIRVRTDNHADPELVESFTLPVPATSYAQAQQLAYEQLKQWNSFEELMTLIASGNNEPQKGNA